MNLLLETLEQLNDILIKKSPILYESLSDFGKRLFLPKGILIQGKEAKEKAHNLNATIGIATKNKNPLYLPSLLNYINNIHPKDIFPYSPSTGKIALRYLWGKNIYKKNPSLKNLKLSIPIVTAGITHGLSLTGDLFINPKDILILSDQYWENYHLIYKNRYRANIDHYPFFNSENNFNLKAFEKCLEKNSKIHKKLLILLNFPNNPTGFTPSLKETKEIINIIVNQANKGSNIICIIDDAYFGLVYDDNRLEESLFAHLVGKHENIIAIKLDGATKENYAWGFRIGFITFALNQNNNVNEIYSVLEKKLTAAIRSSISNVSNLTQSLIYETLKSPNFQNEMNEKYKTIKKRALKIKTILSNRKYESTFNAYPFNSGYFMCLKLKNTNAEKLRLHLLNKYQIGIIANNDSDIRIAFSCIEEEKIEELFEIIYKSIKELK